MHFRCHSLDFVIIQNSSSTSKIKNSDTPQLLYSPLFLLSSCLNSFDHPYNFSLISVLLPSLPSLSFLHSSFSHHFLNSPPHYPYHTELNFLKWILLSYYCWASLQKKQQGRVLSLRVHGNHHQQGIRHCQLILLSSIRSLFYSPQGGFHIFSAVLNPTTSSHPSNSQSRWHRFWLHRKDSSPQKGLQLPTNTFAHLCTYAAILPSYLLPL